VVTSENEHILWLVATLGAADVLLILVREDLLLVTADALPQLQ